MKNYATAVFRIGDDVGPDYVCSKCNLTGHRLWRESHTMLCNIELLCAACAEEQEIENIARYAHFHEDGSTTIGNLVPARATPEGDNFWGHTSGDVMWWIRLPQYQDPVREIECLRAERNRQAISAEEYAGYYLKNRQRVYELEQELAILRNRKR